MTRVSVSGSWRGDRQAARGGLRRGPMDRAGPVAIAAATVLAMLVGASPSSRGAAPLLLADPTAPIEAFWTEKAFGTPTTYRRVSIDGVPYIRATGQKSASGLYREVGEYKVADHPCLEWTWRVDSLQRTADIRTKGAEDFAAAIFLVFGRPTLISPDVPTLAYVWTSGRVPRGDVVPSPRHPGSLRSIVLESGEQKLGAPVAERRNIAEDFRRAFGRNPPDRVEAIALWSDSDQTGEPVDAYYGAVLACGQ